MKYIKNSPLFFLENKPISTNSDGTPVEHKNLEKQSQLTNEIIVFLKTYDGKEMCFNSRTVSYQNKVFIAPLPNPVHILLNSGIENYNNSQITLDLLKRDCQLDENEKGVHILNIGSDNTNQNFNNLINFKMTSVISLITSMEAFLNQIIPNDFIYVQERNGKISNLNKKKIESSKVSFNEKLTKVVAQFLKKPDFETENIKTINLIQELYTVRREIIHLKTNSDNEMNVYSKSTGSIIDIDLENAIIGIKNYINLVKPKFVE